MPKTAPRYALVGFVFLLAVFVRADSPAPPVLQATASPQGGYIFCMVPKYEYSPYKDLSYGIAYELLPTGRLKELWRTQDWYSFQVFLSDDGRHLVRMGPWSFGHEPGPTDLALAFYEDGKLLKSYSTAELVKDHSKVSRSVSHYTWQAGRPNMGETIEERSYPYLDWDNRFYLKTIDGIVYRFDVTTGAIVSAQASSTGWATAAEIDRLTIALALANEPFDFPQIANLIGLPKKTQSVMEGFGGNTRSRRLALTEPVGQQGYYALDVEIQVSEDSIKTMTSEQMGKVLQMHLIYLTPDQRELTITPRKGLEEMIEKMKQRPRALGETPRSLSERAMSELTAWGPG